jgi:hypothetical protein
MAKLPDIMRVVAIEHKGEKIQLEIHIHLSQEEIERIVAPAVFESLGKQLRMQASVPLTSVPLPFDPDDYPVV